MFGFVYLCILSAVTLSKYIANIAGLVAGTHSPKGRLAAPATSANESAGNATYAPSIAVLVALGLAMVSHVAHHWFDHPN